MATILRFHPVRLRLVPRIMRNSLRSDAGNNVVVMPRWRSKLLTHRIENLTLNPQAPFPLKLKEEIFNSNLSY